MCIYRCCPHVPTEFTDSTHKLLLISYCTSGAIILCVGKVVLVLKCPLSFGPAWGSMSSPLHQSYFDLIIANKKGFYPNTGTLFQLSGKINKLSRLQSCPLLLCKS